MLSQCACVYPHDSLKARTRYTGSAYLSKPSRLVALSLAIPMQLQCTVSAYRCWCSQEEKSGQEAQDATSGATAAAAGATAPATGAPAGATGMPATPMATDEIGGATVAAAAPAGVQEDRFSRQEEMLRRLQLPLFSLRDPPEAPGAVEALSADIGTADTASRDAAAEGLAAILDRSPEQGSARSSAARDDTMAAVATPAAAAAAETAGTGAATAMALEDTASGSWIEFARMRECDGNGRELDGQCLHDLPRDAIVFE